MNKSADALEHEVEATRGRLETTLADLSSRLNPASLAEELTGSRDPGGAARETSERMARAVRLNPLPALLIGAGLAFLVYDAVRREAERRRLRVLSEVAPRRPPGVGVSGTQPPHGEARLDGAPEETLPGGVPGCALDSR